MDVRIAKFEWDPGNLDHCRKHGVSQAEVEGVFAGTVIVLPDEGHSAHEPRLRAIGKTVGGRHVFVVFTLRERGGRRYIRPVSARYMHAKEVRSYEAEAPDV